MTHFHIISTVFVLIGSIYMIVASRRISRKAQELQKLEASVNEAYDALCEYAQALHRKTSEAVETTEMYEELFITADSKHQQKEIQLKISFDEIDINRVKDRATRNFLLKRRLFAVCLN